MRVLFCNIAWMKNYNGINKNDKPVNGGSFVTKNGDATEAFNFKKYYDKKCHGFVATKSNKGRFNQLHIERFEGVSEDAKEVNDVLVIWVAKDPARDKSYIVGWYKNATVCRYYYDLSNGWIKNIYADSNDCVLLPMNKRQKIVPRAGKKGYSYGMGSANVWFGKKGDEKANEYIKNMVEYVNNYDGESLI
ncbi:hypothetical protein QYB63_001450 [Clostridium perfringens]|nr:hypothetical protein [Clostridium perfringens]